MTSAVAPRYTNRHRRYRSPAPNMPQTAQRWAIASTPTPSDYTHARARARSRVGCDGEHKQVPYINDACMHVELVYSLSTPRLKSVVYIPAPENVQIWEREGKVLNSWLIL